MFLETPWFQLAYDKCVQRDLSICYEVQGKVILTVELCQNITRGV